MHRILLLISRLHRTPDTFLPNVSSSPALERVEKARTTAFLFAAFFLITTVVLGVVLLYFETHYDVSDSETFDNLKFALGVSVLLLGQGVIYYSQKKNEVYQHKSTHAIANTTNELVVNAQVAANTSMDAANKSEAAAQKVDTAIGEVKKQLEPLVTATNGNLKQSLEAVFEKAKDALQSAPPGSTVISNVVDEFKQAIDDRCSLVAEAAAKRAVDESMKQLREAGLLPKIDAVPRTESGAEH